MKYGSQWSDDLPMGRMQFCPHIKVACLELRQSIAKSRSHCEIEGIEVLVSPFVLIYILRYPYICLGSHLDAKMT